jgi:PhnB protein
MNQSIEKRKEPTQPRDLEIAITRIVGAMPDKVFEAWLRPAHLLRWWGPREGRQDFSTPHVEVDPRPGGIFRTCIRSPRGDDYWARGVYTKIDAPHHLAFSHGWENEKGEVDRERIASVEFAATDDKTRVAFRIGGFDSMASRDSEIEGWNECLDRLVQYFAGNSGATRESRVQGTIEARANAIRSKDVQGAFAHFTKDSVGYLLDPPLQQSPIKEDLAGWFATWRGPIGYEISNLNITVGDDVAYAHGLCRLTGSRTDGEDTDVWFRETFCLRKINDQWLITHLHQSVPFYMDGSFKAAVDLKP